MEYFEDTSNPATFELHNSDARNMYSVEWARPSAVQDVTERSVCPAHESLSIHCKMPDARGRAYSTFQDPNVEPASAHVDAAALQLIVIEFGLMSPTTKCKGGSTRLRKVLCMLDVRYALFRVGDSHTSKTRK